MVRISKESLWDTHRHARKVLANKRSTTFTIYALSTSLDLQPSAATEAALEAAVVEGKVLAQ
jgi:hypothetical protein